MTKSVRENTPHKDVPNIRRVQLLNSNICSIVPRLQAPSRLTMSTYSKWHEILG
jgi:hypothetical protein